MKNLIKQFNQPDTYLVISDYPEKTKKGERNYGMAWHTKEIIDAISQRYGVKHIVLAETGLDNKPKLYENNKILVLRVFDQKHPSLFPRILRWLFIFNNVKQVHVHSEFCANGGMKNSILLIPFLLLIKLTGKKITYYAHNVVTELDSIATHLNINNRFMLHFLNAGLKSYYRTLGHIVDSFVVMDSIIQKRLSLFVKPSKIALNPFWITPSEAKVSEAEARTQLKIKNDEFVIVSFGFITYYKGSDWIIETVKKLRKQDPFKKIRLILAGGEAYSLKDKPYYQSYYQKVLNLVKNEKNITITGFVAENMIEVYLKAANLVVLPYRGLIGASGTLTHALAHGRPFVMSASMDELLDAPDVQTVMQGLNLSKKDLTFEHKSTSFSTVLKKAQNPEYSAKLAQFSKNIASARGKDTLVEQCFQNVYLKKVTPSFAFFKASPVIVK